MKYCSTCGNRVTLKTPEDDHRPRFVCDSCHTIHYENPRLITGTVPVAPDGRIVLCRRNIEPQKNMWTLPAGFMENGESTLEGALRETYEEATIKGQCGQLLSIISLPQWNQIHVFYILKMSNFDFETTPESSEIRLFNEHEIPWKELAFKTVEHTLTHYFGTLKSDHFVLNTSVTP